MAVLAVTAIWKKGSLRRAWPRTTTRSHRAYKPRAGRASAPHQESPKREPPQASRKSSAWLTGKPRQIRSATLRSIFSKSLAHA